MGIRDRCHVIHNCVNIVYVGSHGQRRRRWIMAAAVTIEKLSKSFGATRALDGLDLEVETGEVHGFLGPNASGKSTTIRILLGLLRADAGSARLLGLDPWRDVATLHRRLAYVCLLYTSDAADDLLCVDLGGRRIIKKKKRTRTYSMLFFFFQAEDGIRDHA